MWYSACLQFTLLHLAHLHFSFPYINVDKSKYNNISVINVSVIRMHQCISNSNVYIIVVDKECSNTKLKYQMKKIKSNKSAHSLIFMCNT